MTTQGAVTTLDARGVSALVTDVAVVTDGKFPNGLAAAMDSVPIGVTALGRLVGESKQNIERWRKGQRRLKPEDAEKLAPHVNSSAAVLLQIPEVPETRVAGKVGAGGAIRDMEQDTGDLPRISVLAGHLESAAAVEISGDSLGRFEGWYAVFERRDAFHDGLYGRLCVVETADGDVLIKWIERTKRKGVKLVSGDGAVHADGVQLRWAGPVIGMRPR